MTSVSSRCLMGIAFLLSAISAADSTDQPQPYRVGEYLSPHALVANEEGSRLYIAESTANRISVVDPTARKPIAHFPLDGPPSGLALSEEHSKLFVTLGQANGQIVTLDSRTGERLAIWKAGHSPCAPVLSLDGKTLFVCNRFNHNVSLIDTSTGTLRCAPIPVDREPHAAAISRDGSSLLVVNHLPSGPSNADSVAAQVSVVDATERKLAKHIALPNGSTSVRGICVSHDGAFAYVSHTLARYLVPTTQLERGWVNTNAISIIDLGDLDRLATVLLDDIDRGAANPWGLACTPDGASLCVLHAGSHELSIIDRISMHRKIDSRNAGQLHNDLSFLTGIRERIPIVGKGPRAAVIVSDHLYYTEYFSDSIGVMNIASSHRGIPGQFLLGPVQPMTTTRRGELLFHDAGYCFQTWQSCTSCHPGDRADALNWDLLNDGIGNPKNTKSLLFSHQTPPAMSTGVRASAEVAVRHGLRFMMAELPESDAVAIDTFLQSMQPVPSPYLVEGRLSESARRGKLAFQKARCIRCHRGTYLTDQQMHDVGTGTERDQNSRYDTPSLIEVWRTAPYLHDGRSPSIREIFTKHDPENQHGDVGALDKQEFEDLIMYLLSL